MTKRTVNWDFAQHKSSLINLRFQERNTELPCVEESLARGVRRDDRGVA